MDENFCLYERQKLPTYKAYTFSSDAKSSYVSFYKRKVLPSKIYNNGRFV